MMANSAQDLAKELQSKREQLGYSLKDVAEHTRIRKFSWKVWRRASSKPSRGKLISPVL
jgi:hypothetical protein